MGLPIRGVGKYNLYRCSVRRVERITLSKSDDRAEITPERGLGRRLVLRSAHWSPVHCTTCDIRYWELGANREERLGIGSRGRGLTERLARRIGRLWDGPGASAEAVAGEWYKAPP